MGSAARATRRASSAPPDPGRRAGSGSARPLGQGRTPTGRRRPGRRLSDLPQPEDELLPWAVLAEEHVVRLKVTIVMLLGISSVKLLVDLCQKPGRDVKVSGSSERLEPTTTTGKLDPTGRPLPRIDL